MVKIKLCGLSRCCDIFWANEMKPEYVGFVFAKSHRQVTEEEAGMFRHLLHPDIQAVGVFVDEKPEKVAAIANAGIIQLIQLHGREDEAYIWRLRIMTDIPIIKAFSIMTEQDMKRAEASSADFVILDNGPGGTGKRFDWQKVTPIHKPVFLAGGLDPDNVTEVLMLHPYAVDVSSGIETYGVKDKEKMKKFIAAVRKGNVNEEAIS